MTRIHGRNHIAPFRYHGAGTRATTPDLDGAVTLAMTSLHSSPRFTLPALDGVGRGLSGHCWVLCVPVVAEDTRRITDAIAWYASFQASRASGVNAEPSACSSVQSSATPAAS